MKKDKHRTRITVGGNNIKYKVNVDTSTAHLEITKLLFYSVLSRKNVKFMTIDVSHLYLMTPINEYKYLRMKFTDIPHEMI